MKRDTPMALVLALTTSFLWAQPAAPPDLSGVYAVVGREGDSDYTGAAVLRKRGDGYIVHLATATLEEGEAKGLSSTIGVGLLENNRLSVAWRVGEVLVGVTVYELGKDGSLSGRWLAFPGPGQAGQEKLIRLGPVPRPTTRT